MEKSTLKSQEATRLPWCSVARLCAFNVEGVGSIPGQGTKIQDTAEHGQKEK